MGQHRKTRKKRMAGVTPNVVVAEESGLRLPPENDLGNVEYKSQLVGPTESRLQHLATQMRWRLAEGDGQAVYELGVLDDGEMQGLNPHDLAETMKSMHKMAVSAGASLFVVSF